MAIKKHKELANGFSGEYWIAEPASIKSIDMTSIYLVLYKDQATREAGKKFLEKVLFGTAMPGCYHTGEEVYAFIKTPIIQTDPLRRVGPLDANWWSDAEDVL